MYLGIVLLSNILIMVVLKNRSTSYFGETAQKYKKNMFGK